MRRALAAALAAASLTGCVPPAWDVDALEAREPHLRAAGAGRLGDATPYLLPVDGALLLFLCRWDTREPIPVSLPADASRGEREALEAALRAWESAGLGVRFERRGPSAGLGIEILLTGGEVEGAGPGRGATTVADCALDSPLDTGADPLAARLVVASIHLGIAEVDPLGRRRPPVPEEIAGAALHELGHALGFQGHVRAGASVMRRQVDSVRRVGRRVLAGEPFEDDAVRALYSVPSGVRVGRLALPAGRTQPADRLLALARSGALSGPVVRVGDLEGQLLFRDREGAAHTLWLRGIGRVLVGQPEALEIVPAPRALRLLSLR